MLLGAIAGVSLALADVPTTWLGLSLSGATCGVVTGLVVAVGHRSTALSYRYFADWFLLFGICLGTGLLLCSGSPG